MGNIEHIPNETTKCSECGGGLTFIDVGFGPLRGPSFCQKCDMTEKEFNLYENKEAGFDDFVIHASLMELEEERENMKIKFKDLKEKPAEFIIKNTNMPTIAQDNAWGVNINGVEVSIIKGSKYSHYGGDYEIYSNGILFEDVERYSSEKSLFERLNELKAS